MNVEYLEPAEGTDREAALRQMASGAPNVVFGIGMLFSDDITAVANEYPEKKFACVDYAVPEGTQMPANLVGLKFREEEGRFLVGAIAGLVTKTNTVGFVGGMDTALIHKFEAGYRAGRRGRQPGLQGRRRLRGGDPERLQEPREGEGTRPRPV